MLIAMLALVGVGALYLFVKQLDANQVRIASAQRTAEALALAKQALIGRSASDDNRPGSLPCPDLMTNIPGNNIPGDGKADLLAGINCPANVGWLPWKTLGLPELRDESGERLWYALSPSLNSGSSSPINSNTNATLFIDGANQIAAIIFSPGPPLAGQSRPSNNAFDYLDGGNATNPPYFVSGPTNAGFNDRVLVITRDELFRAVGKRVLAELRGTGTPVTGGLLKYPPDSGTGKFPFADDTDPDRSQNSANYIGTVPIADLSFPSITTTWLSSNGWPDLVSYKVQPGQTSMTIELNGMSITCSTASCP